VKRRSFIPNLIYSLSLGLFVFAFGASSSSAQVVTPANQSGHQVVKAQPPTEGLARTSVVQKTEEQKKEELTRCLERRKNELQTRKAESEARRREQQEKRVSAPANGQAH
jgi:hypothetical protein